MTKTNGNYHRHNLFKQVKLIIIESNVKKMCPYCFAKLDEHKDSCFKCGKKIRDNGLQVFKINNKYKSLFLILIGALLFCMIIFYISPIYGLIISIIYGFLAFLGYIFANKKVEISISHERIMITKEERVRFRVLWSEIKEINVIQQLRVVGHNHSPCTPQEDLNLEIIYSNTKLNFMPWICHFSQGRQMKIIKAIEEFSEDKNVKLNRIKSDTIIDDSEYVRILTEYSKFYAG